MRGTMLLFFDIDGTLFDDQRHLPPTVKPSLEAARGNGHRLIINTGRTLCNLDHRLDEFPIDGWIMGCGTRVIYHGETLQSMEYDPDRSLKLRNLFRALGIPVVYECDTAMYFDPETSMNSNIRGFREFAEQHGIAREITEDDPEFRAVKMFGFADETMIRKMESCSAELEMPYVSINRRPGAWEIVPRGYSKGTGIDFLRGRLDVRKEDCYAFGDSRNDLTMFRHAGHSIAMGNATDDVKAVCTYVTDRPENDGIQKALKYYKLI